MANVYGYYDGENFKYTKEISVIKQKNVIEGL